MRRKLVVFVPASALESVCEALFAAGARRSGEYERCAWYTAGTGTFLAGEGAKPSIGEVGQEQRVTEYRLETVYPSELEAAVVRALIDSHPYERPAFDLYELLEPEL
ncbi:MAG: NGG1p interacting factor NIF3 [Gaiellaceae bacterium]